MSNIDTSNIPFDSLIIETLGEKENMACKMVNNLLHSEDEEQILTGLDKIMDNARLQEIIYKVKPTYYLFLLDKEFEHQDDVHDTVVEILRSMDREYSDYIERLLQYDEYATKILARFLENVETTEYNKKSILFTVKNMTKHKQYAATWYTLMPSVMMEYSPNSENRQIAAYILDQMVGLGQPAQVNFIKNNGLVRISNIFETNETENINTGIVLLMKTFLLRDKSVLKVFNQYLQKTDIFGRLANFLDVLQKDDLLTLVKLLSILIMSGENTEVYVESGIMLYLISLIEFPFKNGVNGDTVSIAFQIIQYVFYNPNTKNKTNEYGFTSKLVQAIRNYKSLSSASLDVVLNTVMNMMNEPELRDQFVFFKCRDEVERVFANFTDKQKAMAKTILANIEVVERTIQKVQVTDEKAQTDMQKVLGSIKYAEEKRAQSQKDSDDVISPTKTPDIPRTKHEPFVVNLNPTSQKEIPPKAESPQPKFQAAKKRDSINGRKTFLAERKSFRLSKGHDVTLELQNLPEFSQIASTTSKITVDDAKVIAELNMKKEKRKLIIQEMYTTEKTYVTQMEKFVSSVLPTLLSLMPPAAQMVGNYKNIFDLHKMFFEKLEKRFLAQKTDPLIVVSDLFMELFEKKELGDEYLKYLSNSEGALKYNFSAYSPQMKQQVMKWGQSCIILPNFLILPVQRLPRYILLLETLIKHTPEVAQEEYGALKDVYALGKKVTMQIDSEKKKIVKKQTLDNYEKSTTNYQPNAGRSFIRDGVMSVKGKSKMAGTVVLMSDVLLVLSKKKNTFVIKYSIDLNAIKIVPNDSNSSLRTIQLLPEKGKEGQLTMFFPVDVDFDGWLADLRNTKK
ncbi:Rho/RAC guanine nucleotide exchange factor, putative [Entamoeba invadens IP1]|uniref:Rho/RAC guanine nucleotide exchange factor, putative n=1 Tax=Entamoeba invadens IP1 TaxID=370355 RepID=A0A0A1U1H6_ENTIV|nr:Rho/RAC guanine nucleotide exchange factor, putative [Entamoeba invadens IP1]ELP86453.1 Rho/RAC guanine nucleotide exchange factor, putative [Entamoeba invadens IP1]|eukprot:XP_004185799.1 Rho/RAC guanine nucleotide exchange factor, putative [Entamoeba invadens IP1]